MPLKATLWLKHVDASQPEVEKLPTVIVQEINKGKHATCDPSLIDSFNDNPVFLSSPDQLFTLIVNAINRWKHADHGVRLIEVEPQPSPDKLFAVIVQAINWWKQAACGHSLID